MNEFQRIMQRPIEIPSIKLGVRLRIETFNIAPEGSKKVDPSEAVLLKLKTSFIFS